MRLLVRGFWLRWPHRCFGLRTYCPDGALVWVCERCWCVYARAQFDSVLAELNTYYKGTA